jgi:HlyD family secretion protein
MREKRILWLLIGTVLIAGLLSACDSSGTDALRASGVVEAVEVVVAPELSGRVVEVFVDEGDSVQEGDALFSMDDEVVTQQTAQAEAAYKAALASQKAAKSMLESADAGLSAAQAGVELATVQYDMELAAARAQASPARTRAWTQVFPYSFDLPAWYFEQSEYLAGAEAEIEAANEMLADERANYEAVLEASGADDLIAAEERLLKAQAAFEVAKDLWERQIASQKRSYMDDFIDDLYDEAKDELEAAQDDYDELLSDDAAEDVLEARARLAVAIERLETALDQRDQLLVGKDSLRVQAAQAGIEQAEANLTVAKAAVEQAQAAVDQADTVVTQTQAALNLLEVQFEKLTVRASVSGVLMTRSVQPGEVVVPGMTLMTIGQLERLTITVYLPEDRYGQIALGDEAEVSVDSFPDETFEAVVVRIANRAEYTPRNVQTEEDRRTTVYAVELAVDDPGDSLKPGMPADVVFEMDEE